MRTLCLRMVVTGTSGIIEGPLIRIRGRILPLFETGDDRYAWLNQIVTVGVGGTGDDSVIYDVYAVK